MTDAYVTIGNARVRRLTLNVPNVGVWVCEAEFLEAPDLVDGQRVDVVLGTARWSGTIAAGENGVFALGRRCLVRGGGGGWSRTLPAKHYHNDVKVRALEVAQDLARETGETLGDFTPARERIGVDFVRDAGTTAAGTLSAVIGGVPWWVGADGRTNVGMRPATAVNPGGYELMAFDPRLRIATLGVTNNDTSAIQIGATLVDQRLDRPGTIREYTIDLAEDKLRVHAYCGGDENTTGNLAALLTAIVRRAVDDRLLGRYRFRVVRMLSDGRADLQAVNAAAGVPDLRYVAQWPGVAGMHGELAAGAECLVEFLGGDRAQPIITGFAGKTGVGFVPAAIVIGKGADAEPVARVDDVIACAPYAPTDPPGILPQTITLAGTGAGAGTYTFSFSPVPVPGEVDPQAVLLGRVVTGSPLVKSS